MTSTNETDREPSRARSSPESGAILSPPDSDLRHLDLFRHSTFDVRHLSAAVLAFAAVACLCFLLLNLFRREGYTGDEGFYGVTAQNMLHSPAYILRPSYYPLGDFAEDKDGFAHPPFNSYFYALGLWLFKGSLAGPHIVNAISFALLLFFSFRVLQLFDNRAAIFATLLLSVSPAIALDYFQLEAEPLMTTFGIAALYYALRGGFAPVPAQGKRRTFLLRRTAAVAKPSRSMSTRSARSEFATSKAIVSAAAESAESDDTSLLPISRLHKSYFFISGLCLGFSFALKLWLFGPLALAVLATLGLRAVHSSRFFRRSKPFSWLILPTSNVESSVRSVISIENLSPKQHSELRRSGITAALLLFLLGALIPASLHLLAIACFYPGDLSFWLKNIYFGIFTNAGISGGKLEGAGVSADWIHPFWYYGAALYRDHFFLLPITLLGLGSVLRDQKLRGGLLWITVAGIAGVIPLSLIKVKEPLYVLSSSIFIYFLAGICLAALIRRISSGAQSDRFSTRVAPFVVLGMLILVPLAFIKGIQAGKITGAFVVAHSITFTITLAAFLWSQRRKTGALLEWATYATCAVALLTIFTYDFITRRPRDQIIAALIRPCVKSNASGDLSFIASNFKCYQFYSFHRGCYWHELPPGHGPDTLLATPEFQRVHAFIIDPDDQEKPSITPWLRWLEKNAQEKTADLNTHLGSPSGFRLFVRNGS